MASKVVPQGIQNRIKENIVRMLDDSELYEEYVYDKSTGNLIVENEYEVIMVVIPAQANYNTEVRNG